MSKDEVRVTCPHCGRTEGTFFVLGLLFFGAGPDEDITFSCTACGEPITVSSEKLHRVADSAR